jgi:hypothetical protein
LVLSQLASQSEEESKTPPIQIPETVSSTPSQRDSPSPAITAAVQTGQTAKAGFGNSRAKPGTVKNTKSLKDFFMSF